MRQVLSGLNVLFFVRTCCFHPSEACWGVSSAAQARGGQRQQLSVALQLFGSKNGGRLHCFLLVILCHQPQLHHENLKERKSSRPQNNQIKEGFRWLELMHIFDAVVKAAQ
jgi:hypothetical protein